MPVSLSPRFGGIAVYEKGQNAKENALLALAANPEGLPKNCYRSQPARNFYSGAPDTLYVAFGDDDVNEADLLLPAFRKRVQKLITDFIADNPKPADAAASASKPAKRAHA